METFPTHCGAVRLQVLNLLPIREAYEWKPGSEHESDHDTDLLPIREAYEWKLLGSSLSAKTRYVAYLLPIREAYEWKLFLLIALACACASCFQFVKRMNGNVFIDPFFRRD